MSDEMNLKAKTERDKMTIDLVGFVAEIINNISDHRDVIRELVSNAASREVGAKRIEIRVYESDMGLAITIADDGCGMDYARNGTSREDWISS